MKTGRSVPSASPRASKEAVKIDVGSRVLKRDEDVAHAPSASHHVTNISRPSPTASQQQVISK